MKSGSWIGGFYAEVEGIRPYASGYPEIQELYLARSLQIDPEDGSFVLDENDQLIRGSGSLLMRWEEIEMMEFIHIREEEEVNEQQAST